MAWAKSSLPVPDEEGLSGLEDLRHAGLSDHLADVLSHGPFGIDQVADFPGIVPAHKPNNTVPVDDDRTLVQIIDERIEQHAFGSDDPSGGTILHWIGPADALT